MKKFDRYDIAAWAYCLPARIRQWFASRPSRHADRYDAAAAAMCFPAGLAWQAARPPVEGPQQAEFFVLLLMFAATLILAETIRPKPKNENAKPAGLGDFSFPTATEGRAVPLVWGTVQQKGGNVVWYDDLRQDPITEKVKTGLWSSARVVKGYTYYIGFQMALCRGGAEPVDSVRKVWVGDKLLWEGDADTDGEAITIDEPDFFGGDDLGKGGLVGTLRFHSGSLTQPVNDYLTNHQSVGGQTPRYIGTCYCVWEHGRIGNSTQIEPWAFEIRRIPNGLNLVTPSVNSGNDANLANVLYEAITNTDWGLGHAAATVDTASFEAAAATLLSEGNGFSMLLERTMTVQEFMHLIEQQMDGLVFIDRTTGKWTITLARGGYDVDDLILLDETNLKEVASFSRGSWADTANSVMVKFTDRQLEYTESFAGAQDNANANLQGRFIHNEVVHPGVMDADLANSIAWRNLRTTAYPLARAEVVADRTFWAHNPGDLIKWTNTRLGLDNVPMRITQIDVGDMTGGDIRMVLVEDIFSYSDGVFASPADTLWEPPAQTVVAIPTSDSIVIEAPRKFAILDSEQPGVFDRIWVAGRQQGDAAAEIGLVSRTGASAYTPAGEVADFVVAGQIDGALTATGTQGSITLTIDVGPDALADMTLDLTDDVTSQDVGRRLTNLVLVGDEFFAFRTVDVTGGQLVLGQGYRGLLDSAPQSHDDDSRAWILVGNLTTRVFNPGTAYDVKLLPESGRDSLDVGDATEISVTMANRARCPYPPVSAEINSAVYPTGTVSLDTSWTAGLDNRGLAVEYIRRDYRNEDEAAAVVDEASLPTDFPAANTTEYAVEVREDPTGADTLLFTTDWNDGSAQINISRTKILRETAGTIPTSLGIRIETRHTIDGVVREAIQTTDWDFDTSSSELSGDFLFGVLAQSDVSSVFAAPSTGTYVVTLGVALASGAVEYRLDGGAWTTAVTAGMTTGSFAATAGQSIEIRHNEPGDNSSETFLSMSRAATTVAFAILTY